MDSIASQLHSQIKRQEVWEQKEQGKKSFGFNKHYIWYATFILKYLYLLSLNLNLKTIKLELTLTCNHFLSVLYVPGGETFDECGLKFLLAVRLHTFLSTSLPPVHRAQLLGQGTMWFLFIFFKQMHMLQLYIELSVFVIPFNGF